MAQHHLQTFANTKAFTDAYNAGAFGVPYVAVISDIVNSQNKPMVLFSNRLPFKAGEIEAPAKLSHNTVCGEMVVGASRLGRN